MAHNSRLNLSIAGDTRDIAVFLQNLTFLTLETYSNEFFVRLFFLVCICLLQFNYLVQLTSLGQWLLQPVTSQPALET